VLSNPLDSVKKRGRERQKVQEESGRASESGNKNRDAVSSDEGMTCVKRRKALKKGGKKRRGSTVVEGVSRLEDQSTEELDRRPRSVTKGG